MILKKLPKNRYILKVNFKFKIIKTNPSLLFFLNKIPINHNTNNGDKDGKHRI